MKHTGQFEARTGKSSCETGPGLPQPLRIILQGKWLVIGITALFLSAAVMHVYVTKPVYEASAIIQVGHIGGSGPIEELPSLVDRFNGLLPQGQNPSTAVVSAIPQQKDRLKIVVDGQDAQVVKELLDLTVNSILEEHKQSFDKQRQLYMERLEYLNSKQKIVREILTDTIQYIPDRKEPLDKMQIAANYYIIEIIEADTFNKISSLEKNMSAEQSFVTKIISGPPATARQIKPQPAYEIILAGFAGLASGVFGLLLVHYFRSLHSSIARRQ